MTICHYLQIETRISIASTYVVSSMYTVEPIISDLLKYMYTQYTSLKVQFYIVYHFYEICVYSCRIDIDDFIICKSARRLYSRHLDFLDSYIKVI